MAVLKQTRLFVGYSTLETNSKKQQFTDIALIQRDLINNFYTRPGERLMMPTYGCGIWDLLFEPFDPVTIDSIVYQAQQVINNDSRVQMKNINVRQFEQGLLIQMELLYVPFDVVETFTLSFDNRSAQMV